MKKSKARSVSDLLETVWSSTDSVTEHTVQSSSKSKSTKENKKKKRAFSQEAEKCRSDIEKMCSKKKSVSCDNSTSNQSDSDTQELLSTKRKGRHSPVGKSFSLGDMLARRRISNMKKSNSMKSLSRPQRPTTLSLKTPVSTLNTSLIPMHDNKPRERRSNLNNNSYSCSNMMTDLKSSKTYTRDCRSYSNSSSPSAVTFTTLELGPVLRLPGDRTVTKKDSLTRTKDVNSQKDGKLFSCIPTDRRKSEETSNKVDGNLTYRNFDTPKRPLTHREKRKMLRATNSFDIDSQEDITIRPLDPRQDVCSMARRKRTSNSSKSSTDSKDSTKTGVCPKQTKPKMVTSQSYDDILKLDRSPKSMDATYSTIEKDYLKVPQRGQSVDFSIDSDFKPDARRQRFRSYSNTYTTNLERECEFYLQSADRESYSYNNKLSQENTSTRPMNKSQHLSKSYKCPEHKASFVISPSNESPPSNPFTFDARSKPPLKSSNSLDLIGTSPPRTNDTDFNRTCRSAEAKQTSEPKVVRKPPRSPVSYPRFLSHATDIVSPTCETCSPPSNRILNRLVRRFSLRRKPSKEKNRKAGSVDDLLKYSFGVGDLSRRSLESDTSICSYAENATDSDMSSLHDIEHESLYRGVIRCLLHPLGAPGMEIGLRPGDLLDHVKLVFDVPHPDHAFYIREELQNVPTKVQASVTLLEAKNLSWTEEHGGVYCLLTQTSPYKGNSGSNTISSTTSTATSGSTSTTSNGKSPKNSPRVSPKNSPRSSPKFVKSPPRSPSMDCDPLRSHTCPNTHDPKWNECFHIDLDDTIIDEITIFVCYYDKTNSYLDTNNSKQPEKGHTLKTFFKNIRQAGHDHEKSIPGCFGRVDLPIRDIPTEGCDKWFNILPIGSWNKHKPIGQLRLQVAVSSKHATMNNYFCAEDYHQASLLEHKYAAAAIMDADGLDLSLSRQAQKVLNIFAVANGISKLSQKIMNLTVFLELVFSRYSHTVTDSVLHRAMEDVQMTWCEMQVRGGGDFLEKMPLCDAEICLYRSATRRYIDAIIEKLDEMPVLLFPPSMDTIHNLKAHFGIGLHLLELDLWDAITSPQRDLGSALVNKLQKDVRVWMEGHLDSIHHKHGPVKDVVIPEVEALTKVTNSLVSILTPLGVVEQFFLGLDVKYYRIVYFESERKLSLKVRELMMSLDKYQTRYHSYRVNLNRSCRLSIKLFLAVRSYYNTVKEVFDDRDLFRLSIPLYQEWFQEAVVFWLQMFRAECTSRIQKALEIDKDLVLVTSQLKYSNSSVDAQACFSEITQEWRQIDIKDADTAVMGVTKIVDMICDGARVYASKIQTILERNCYYDDHQTQFDVTERMCITLNNIEHVRMYLSELPDLLGIHDVTARMGQKHENEAIGHKSLDTLCRLIQNADHDILQMSSGILRKVCQKMSVEVKNNMDRFLVKTPERSTATDKVIGYLNTNLKTLKLRLSETIFPHMASQLWIMVAELFDEHVLVGKPPDYYTHMQQHLRALTMFFSSWSPCQSDLFINFQTPLLDGLRERLEISSWKTERLMREYLHNLSSHMTTPLEYLGHLAVKTAYMEETRGNVTLYVKVIQGIDLPGLDSTGLSDPYVIVNVQPQEIFGQPDQRTKVIGQTLQPVFNATFMFPNIPCECLTERGNCLLLSVMDQDVVTQDDFAGEVVIALDSIQPISMNETVDIAPALLMPLKRPQVELGGPFQVLRERVRWDKSAKQFIKSRLRYIENQPQRTDNNVRERITDLFKFWNKLSSSKNNEAGVT